MSEREYIQAHHSFTNKPTIMNKKMLSMILGAALVGCFFLPYYSFMGSISGFDMVSAKGVDWKVYVLLLIPLAGLLLLVGGLNNNYILGRGLLCWLPLLALLFILIVAPLIEGADIGNIFKAIGKGYGIGMWITIGASVILAFYHPKD
jgi:hypothetical protein